MWLISTFGTLWIARHTGSWKFIWIESILTVCHTWIRASLVKLINTASIFRAIFTWIHNSINNCTITYPIGTETLLRAPIRTNFSGIKTEARIIRTLKFSLKWVQCFFKSFFTFGTGYCTLFNGENYLFVCKITLKWIAPCSIVGWDCNSSKWPFDTKWVCLILFKCPFLITDITCIWVGTMVMIYKYSTSISHKRNIIGAISLPKIVCRAWCYLIIGNHITKIFIVSCGSIASITIKRTTQWFSIVKTIIKTTVNSIPAHIFQ